MYELYFLKKLEAFACEQLILVMLTSLSLSSERHFLTSTFSNDLYYTNGDATSSVLKPLQIFSEGASVMLSKPSV